MSAGRKTHECCETHEVGIRLCFPIGLRLVISLGESIGREATG